MDRREYSRNPDRKWAPGYHPAGRLFLAGFLQTCRECGKDDPTLLHSRNGSETGHLTQISSLSHKADLNVMAGRESWPGFFFHELKLLEMATPIFGERCSTPGTVCRQRFSGKRRRYLQVRAPRIRAPLGGDRKGATSR